MTWEPAEGTCGEPEPAEGACGEPQPRRPCPTTYDSVSDVSRNAFLMDFENACLEYNWHIQPQPFDGGLFDSLSFYWNKPHPKGPKRHEDPEWAAMIQSQVYPHHSDVDWEEYVEWVENGGGDEHFQEDEELEEEPEPAE